MLKKLGIFGLAVALSGGGFAWAQQQQYGTAFSTGQGGPTSVQVQAEVVAEPGKEPVKMQRIIINGQPVQIDGGSAAVTTTVSTPEGGTIAFVGSPENLKLGDYWLGLSVSIPNEETRKEMKLPADQGLMVQNVVFPSPAANAKIGARDILLKAGDKPLKQVQDLLDAVNEAKDKPLVLEVRRAGGNDEKITVTPTKRLSTPDVVAVEKLRSEAIKAQEEATKNQAEALRLRQEASRLELLGKLQTLPGMEGAPFQIQIVGPGAILPSDVMTSNRTALPDDMTIVITKTGKKPAEVMVQWAKEKWEVTDDQLNKLPDRVRRYVDAMLGRVAIGIVSTPGGGINTGVGVFRPADPAVPPVRPQFNQPPATATAPQVTPLENRLERRIEDLNARIDRLTRVVEGLNAPSPGTKKAPLDRPKEKLSPEKPANEPTAEM
jgi:hypothetical protein